MFIAVLGKLKLRGSPGSHFKNNPLYQSKGGSNVYTPRSNPLLHYILTKLKIYIYIYPISFVTTYPPPPPA